MSNLELCMYMSLVKRECVIPPLEFFFNLCGFLIFFFIILGFLPSFNPTPCYFQSLVGSWQTGFGLQQGLGMTVKL